MFTDLSKEETNETFRRIKEESATYVEDNNCRLGLVFSTIGFFINIDCNEDLLDSLEAPLSDPTMAHYYHITTEGKFINYPQLVVDITSHPKIAAVLINEYDWHMWGKAKQIEASHLHADAKGRQAFIEDGLNHVDGQTSLCYWNAYSCTVNGLCNDVKAVRHEQQKTQMQLPSNLSSDMQGYMFDFQEKKSMS